MVTLVCFALGMTDGQNQGFGNSTTLILLAPAEALVYGVQRTFLVAALILGAAAILSVVVWKMERSKARVS